MAIDKLQAFHLHTHLQPPQTWIPVVAQFLRSMDPNHLVRCVAEQPLHTAAALVQFTASCCTVTLARAGFCSLAAVTSPPAA